MRLNQITTPSLNVEESANFYKKLGMHLIVDSFPRNVRFKLPVEVAFFSIHLIEEILSGDNRKNPPWRI